MGKILHSRDGSSAVWGNIVLIRKNFGEPSRTYDALGSLLEASAEVGDVRVYDDRLWREIERAIATPALFGTVVQRGDESDYGAHLSTLLHSRYGASKVLDISCSSYSRAIDYGALLYLLRGPEIVDTSSDVAVFLAIKRKLGKICQEPPVIVIDHADFLDARSAQMLVQLASAGLLRMILLARHLEDLPHPVYGLLHKRQLSVMSNLILTRSQFNQYLIKRLGHEFAPSVASHYWTATRGELKCLETQIKADLRRGMLVKEGPLWELSADQKLIESERDSLGSVGGMIRISESREAKTQWAGQEQPTDRANPRKSMRSRGRLTSTVAFDLSGSGQHEEESNVQHFRVHEMASLVPKKPLEAVQPRLDSLKSVGGCPQSAQGQAELKAREVWAAHEAVGDLDSAYRSIRALEVSRTGTCIGSGLHLQTTVLTRYLEIRRGVPLDRGGPWVLSHQEVLGLLDASWSDESLRLLGMLCVAHALSETGRNTEAKRLLSWSINQFETLNQNKFDLRHRLLVAPITYVAMELATRLKEDTVAVSFSGHVRNLPLVDETAEHYATYFTLVHALGSGQQHDDDYLQSMIRVLQDGPMAKGAGPLIRCAEATIALSHGQHWAGAELQQLTRPAIVNHATLQVAQLSCRSLMRFSETMPRCLPLRELSYSALILGDQLTAIDLSLVATVTGEEFSADIFASIVGDDFSETRAALACLSQAMNSADTGQEMAARINLAERGFYFQLETWSSRQVGLATIDKSRVRRALMKPADSPEAALAQGLSEPSVDLFAWARTLTKRERTIAALAAAGRRNREIATECRISVRTVEGHVYQILAKLGLSSRRELATFIDPSMG
ncbi:response regulator transcription factor [Glutamicibacter protophormiae]|uniref:response regulator transcription factor n=1 Tax=Glutamicibacter protophormiae TaxID=37930 RepID=UPI001EF506E0|nr:helix-turn-helix transcriptional regulator [Glutamicibacter protophormiae]